MGSRAAVDLLHTAATLAESHRYVAAAHFVTDFQDLRPAMALREDLMVEHVRHVLAEAGPQARVVLMGQNLHLARDDRRIAVPDGSIGPGGGLRPSVGTRLADHFGDELLVIWMLDNSRPRQRRTLNRTLATVGSHYLLPTASPDPGAALLRRSRTPIRIMQDHTVRAVTAEQTDLIYFHHTLTPIATASP
jgi:hypothetical protein